jgi:hypothetical protein
MDETDHGLTPRISDLKMNRKVNEINDLPTPPPRQCWICVPPVIALKTREPQESPASVWAKTQLVKRDREQMQRVDQYRQAELAQRLVKIRQEQKAKQSRSQDKGWSR